MRANITINDAGTILAASNSPPPTGGAAVSRVNQKMFITLGAKPTVPALTIVDPGVAGRKNRDHTL